MDHTISSNSTQHVADDPRSNNRHVPLVATSNFTPGPNDVICGKGRACYNHQGNRKLRQIVASKVPEYSRTDSRYEKSQIVSTVIGVIQTSGGNFIRYNNKTGVWSKISNLAMREKVSSKFRDHLSPMYQSSAKRKNAARAAKSRERRRSSSSFEQEEKTSSPLSTMSLSSLAAWTSPTSQMPSMVLSIADALMPAAGTSQPTESMDSTTLKLLQDILIQPPELQAQYSLSGTSIDEVSREPEGGVEAVADDHNLLNNDRHDNDNNFFVMEDFGNFRYHDLLE